jgi:membrane protease YdiL (CAAX protease family)
MDQVDEYAFHRLGLSWPRYRWWKPLLTGLLGITIYLAFVVVLLLVSVVVALATSTDVQQYMDPAAAIDLSDPVIFAFTLLSLIIMIPALVLATLIMGPRPAGLLSSVAGRIRWPWLGLCTLVAIGVYAVSFTISGLIGGLFPSGGVPIQQPDTSTMLILLAMTLLAVPFQAAAEEYVFRGYLMQLVGGWLRHPAFAILLPVPLFVLGHLYDPLGQVDIAVFAIFAGWITWRTGGLEAAIAVHAINNMTIFGLGALGLADVNATEGSVSGLVVSVLTMASTAFVIVWLADRRGIERHRTVPRTDRKLSSSGRRITSDPMAFPAGDGAWHQSAPQQVGAGQPAGRPAPYQGSAPQRHAPHPYDSAQYEPAQYEATRQKSAGPDVRATGTRNAPDASGSHVLRRPDPEPAGPTPVIPAPRASPLAQGPGLQSGVPRPVRPSGQGYPAGTSYPAGQGFPAGPGYPAGISYPAGPGYPSGEHMPAGPRGQVDRPQPPSS